MVCKHVSETIHIMTERKGGGRWREREGVSEYRRKEEEQAPKDPSPVT